MEKYFKNDKAIKDYLFKAEKMESYFTSKEKWILHQEYGTASRLRGVLLNMYNSDSFKEVHLSGLSFNTDDRHKELFHKILNMNIEFIDGCMSEEFSELITYQSKLLYKSRLESK